MERKQRIGYGFQQGRLYWTMGKCLEIEDVVRKHIQIMDKYDPQKKIG